MSWGIAETASEIEKIKSESADYLSGLNSCGVIDWDTYNYAFDFYADLLMKAYEQGRKDAQPEPCEDAVSRHRLLNDLKELIAAWEKYPVMAEQIKGVETAIGYVQKIPSAQPDIIHCKDCKHRSGSYCHCKYSYGTYVWKEHYCGWAERRTDGEIIPE